MKRLLTLFLISISFLASAQTGSFTSSGKTITYKGTSVTNTAITFSDGVQINFTGSVAKAVVQKAYVAYLAAHPPVPAISIVGTGAGELILTDKKDASFKVKAGKYDHIFVNKASNIKLDLSEVTMSNGTLDLTDITNVEVYGLTVLNHDYRPVNIRGFCNGVYLHHMSFNNVKNSVITYEWNQKWDGTEAGKSHNFRFEYITFENTSSILGFGGGFSDQGVFNLMSGVLFNHNIIKNCPGVGSIIWCGAVENYEIAYNVIDHINYQYDDPNAPNGYHNGIFAMTGNGSLHDNICTNHQGNLIRAWGVSFGKEKKDVLIYNNKVWNSWKYSAFELQVPPFIQDFIKANPNIGYSYTNAEVYSNTAGHLNNSNDWEGQMLDVYNTFGTIDYYNNLGFEMKRIVDNKVGSVGITSMLNQMNGIETTVNVQDNNKYFDNWQGAVSDLNTFKSKVTGVGAQ